MKYEEITPQQLGKGSRIGLEIVDTEDDIYHDMARVMVDEIVKNNATRKNTVFIVPVGPVGQYRRLARICNRDKIDLSRVYFFNMDEYLDEKDQPIPHDHPLSFYGFMERECYSLLDEDITIPPANRIFPVPGKEHQIWERIVELGGVDISFGGIGINGHIAFNEPPEQDTPITDAEFAALPTRVLSLTRETRTINSVTAANGFIDYIPPRCITIGMKEILSARQIRFYMNRQWQKGIVRKILHGPVTRFVPASFFQQHPDAKLTITKYVAEMPVGQLR